LILFKQIDSVKKLQDNNMLNSLEHNKEFFKLKKRKFL